MFNSLAGDVSTKMTTRVESLDDLATCATIQEVAVNIFGSDKNDLNDAIDDAMSIPQHVVDQPQTCTIVTYARWQYWPIKVNE
jgi:hypothetical protein